VQVALLILASIDSTLLLVIAILLLRHFRGGSGGQAPQG